MSIIESFTPGRIRLRSSLFKDNQSRDMLSQFLQSLTALKSLQINERTGSCLLEYDPKALNTFKLIQNRHLIEDLKSLETLPDGQQRNEAIGKLCSSLTKILY